MATDPELDKKDPNFDAIRHFKGTWKNFEEFWKAKGARMSPWEEWEEKYPEKKKRINKNPIQMYKTFDDESDVDENKETDILHNPSKGLGRKIGGELVTRKIPTRKEALEIRIGDQVIDKSREGLGIGTVNSFDKDKKTALVQFYDTLQGSTFGVKGDEFEVDVDNLFAVIADDNSLQIEEGLRPDEVEHLAKEIANHKQWDSWEPTDSEVMDVIKKDKPFGKPLLKHASSKQKKEAVKIIQAYLAESVKESKVEQSAGCAIVFGDKVLLGHMSNRKWWGGYTIPKGHLDGNETIKQAALRETFEEVGIKIPSNLLPSQYKTCPYTKRGKGHYKDVHYYTIVIDSLDQLGLKDEVIPKSKLQLEEVDWAGFVPIKEALKRISPVMRPIIESLMIYANDNSFKTFEQFKQDLDEDNMVALAGSSQDYPPMQKPFVVKSKKRRGSNEDDDEDTEEVANVNTTSIGSK